MDSMSEEGTKCEGVVVVVRTSPVVSVLRTRMFPLRLPCGSVPWLPLRQVDPQALVRGEGDASEDTEVDHCAQQENHHPGGESGQHHHQVRPWLHLNSLLPLPLPSKIDFYRE